MRNLWPRRFQSALRYKLLALVLLPLVTAMVATFAYTFYWFHGYTEDSLNVALRDHLAVARQSLRQLQDEHLLVLQQLAASAQLRALLNANDAAAVQRLLQRLRDANGLAFLHVTGVAGDWRYENAETQRSSKPSPLTDRAARGFAGAAFETFREPDLRRESDALVDLARVESRPEPGREVRGLMLRLVQPIIDEHGRVALVLDAGLLLNRNHAALSVVSDRVFASGSLPAGADPMVAVLLDEIRIAAVGADRGNLLGSRSRSGAHARLNQRSDFSTGREEFGGEVYVNAYGPLYDVNGQHVGVLQVGVRENAVRAGYYRAVGLLLLLFVIATAAAAWIAVRGVRAVLKPIEAMAAVARATQAGEDRRIGVIDSHDELGELARQFDRMLDQLAARNREVQRSATALEIKVTERTGELEKKNAELQAAIILLQKTQEQLTLADKLSALGQMAAGIAHEINNPAAVILGNLDVLAAELGPAAQPVAREIELIAQQVERIRHIVTSLLQFARARPGAGSIAEISVNQLVQDVLPLIKHVLTAKTISLHRRLEARGVVAINAFDLEQVLINLVVNAANACDVSGTIEIATADTDDGAVVSVRDSGCGIAPEELKRIFDPFFTTAPQRGAGLGLSVSYGLVQRYGGHISVDSSVGTGSVFRVHLLRRPPTQRERTLTTTSNEEMSYG